MSDTLPKTDRLTVETPESVAFAYDLAGLGSRGVALALDMLMILLLALGELAAGAAVFGIAALARVPSSVLLRFLPWAVGVVLLLWFVTYWGYFIFGEVTRNGRTWGKRRLGIRVVRDDGSRVAVLDSIIRNLMRLVDMLPGNYAVGMIAILLSNRNKRLGDMAAGTVVVRDSGELRLSFETEGLPENVVLARDFLERRSTMTGDARVQVGTAVLRTFGEEPDPGWDEPTLAGRIADVSGLRPPAGGPATARPASEEP